MIAFLVCLVLLASPVDALHGQASWFRAPEGTAAAGPALRALLGDWRGQSVTVCGRSCVTVRLTDWCQCYDGSKHERVIDLSDGDFARLAPLEAGVVRVTITRAIVPPATDTAS